MIRARCDFFSETLGLSTSATILLPQPAAGQIGMGGTTSTEPPPVLYLLHGMSDDDTVWERRTSIERYAAELGLAVVMPAVQRSYYTDEALGLPFWTFLSEELPQLLERTFRFSTAREDTFVAGLSMGGYGAFKLALRHPDRFAAAASLSGALDVASPALWTLRHTSDGKRIWGDEPVADTHNDLLHLMNVATPSALPALYATCGTEDFLVEHTRRIEAIARDRGIALTVDYRPGTHEWSFWDASIHDVLAWLPLRPRG
jgi:putative tributyrin esterase